MTLEQLRAEEKELQSKIEANRKLQRQITANAILDKYSVKIGDHIEYGIRNKRKAVIDNVAGIGSGARINVVLINANGKPGKRKDRIYTDEMESIKVINPLQ